MSKKFESAQGCGVFKYSVSIDSYSGQHVFNHIDWTKDIICITINQNHQHSSTHGCYKKFLWVRSGVLGSLVWDVSPVRELKIRKDAYVQHLDGHSYLVHFLKHFNSWSPNI